MPAGNGLVSPPPSILSMTGYKQVLNSQAFAAGDKQTANFLWFGAHGPLGRVDKPANFL